MTILPFNDASLAQAVTILRDGGVIAHATETCYGFACDLSNPEAVEKLFAIKQRPTMQPVSALFASIDDAKKYVLWNERAEELATQYLPGPLTIILPLREAAPSPLFPTPRQGTTIGVRVSSHPHATLLAAAFGSPISTTSANLHGQPNPYSIDDIVKQFENQTAQPDLILDSGALPQVPPSTVINLTTEDEATLRKGTI